MHLDADYFYPSEGLKPSEGCETLIATAFYNFFASVLLKKKWTPLLKWSPSDLIADGCFLNAAGCQLIDCL